MKCQILFHEKIKKNISKCFLLKILPRVLSVKRSYFLKKVSNNETICMKCQILFPEEIKKNISKCHLLKFLPSVLSVKRSPHF